jgi:hypothetical protein
MAQKQSNNKAGKRSFKINLMEDQSIRQMYQNRVTHLLTQTPMSLNINKEWHLLQSIFRAAMKAVGKREKRCYKRSLHVWNDKLLTIIKTKNEVYLQYINSRSEGNRINYKRLSAIAKREIKKIRRQLGKFCQQ